MKTRRQSFIISVPVIKGASRARMAEYIKEAVESWQGQFEPRDPLYGAFRTDGPNSQPLVKVTAIRETRS